MKQSKPFLQTILFSITLLSLGLSDVGSAITTLVGRNAEGYLAPFGTILGTDMNTGYFRKTTPHKILGFDLTFDVAYAMAPPGQTTYKFTVPHSLIDYNFPFKFPKELLAPNDPILAAALPTAILSDGTESEDESLYQDQEIYLGIYADDLLIPQTNDAQNIFGNDSATIITIDPTTAIKQIKEQVITNTWLIASEIGGIGKDLDFTYTLLEGTPAEFDSTITIKALYGSEAEFASGFSGEIDSLIDSSVSDVLALTVPIPGGLDLGKSFENLPIDFGVPLPIVQASVGLPFHTELTIRGIPKKINIPQIGNLKFGGFGGKIGISEFFKKKPKKEPRVTISPKIKYILETPMQNITPEDIDLAIAELQTTSMDVSSLKILNDQFHNGNEVALNEILAEFNRITEIPNRKRAKPKGWPIDVSIGYYKNDFELEMDDVEVSSINNLFSLQVGKTLNLPSFLAFLGGFGIYGGIGLESSTMDLKYTLANPLEFGCFSNDTWDGNENKTKNECTGRYEKWQSGVPLPINLSFPGDNKFRTTIGARLRILTFDLYADYNTGTSNAYNIGLGFTFR